MFKKFFRKVRDTAKKIAPIAAPLAGAYFGAPMGAGIGALLGQYGGTKGALQGAALGGLGGVLGNMGAGRSGMDLLTKGGLRGTGGNLASVAGNIFKGPMINESGTGNLIRGGGGINSMLGMLKNPYVAGGLISMAAKMLNKPEEEVTREDIEIGSQGQLGDMRIADIEYLPAANLVSPHGYAGYADGGIVALAKGGTPPKNMDDFPRKNGNIAGPGTMTSDDIPAMLSDGEFVTKAVSVIGAGVREGADTIEEAQKKGSDFFYQQQEDLAKLGERIVNGN
jgi:hypothetical protein|tara:strand:+ start:334 stop:1176 length:843 start_codon:yes stop_codon:yes gene_type:complete